jgi:hypothetical protein
MARDKHLWVPTPEGAVDRFVDADEAKTVSAAWRAMNKYLTTHDPSWLDPLKGQTVADVEIISDPDLILVYDESGEWDVVDESISIMESR